jgi:hypothetical protein
VLSPTLVRPTLLPVRYARHIYIYTQREWSMCISLETLAYWLLPGTSLIGCNIHVSSCKIRHINTVCILTGRRVLPVS